MLVAFEATTREALAADSKEQVSFCWLQGYCFKAKRPVRDLAGEAKRMLSPNTPVVLLLELHPGTEHLTALQSILKQSSINVLTVEDLHASSSPNPAWLAQVALENQLSAIILSLDERTLADDLQLNSLLSSFPLDVPIIVAAQNFEPAQIRAVLELGATDFMTPPFTAASVLPRVWRFVRHKTSLSLICGSLREKLAIQRLYLLGESPCFIEEIRKLPSIARCDVTVMIWGKTGTGKELIARAVHYLSPRFDRPFVPIDCSAIPPELAESELFGHERGAFTGAVTKTPGLVSAADQGTLFLDEVDGLGLSVQAKLLRFLQQMEYRPLGSNKIKRADVRVIAATNGDLQQRVRCGEFREDLYYRLNVVQIQLPALWQRREDVVLLARHFLAKYSARFKRPARAFSRDALQRLLMHHWPGNIRELENVVASAVVLCDGPLIRAADLIFPARESQPTVSFREAKARNINEFERDYIVRLLYACGGNISEAARAAGKNRRAFWELVRKHEINVEEFRDSSDDGQKRKSNAKAARVSARHNSTG